MSERTWAGERCSKQTEAIAEKGTDFSEYTSGPSPFPCSAFFQCPKADPSSLVWMK